MMRREWVTITALTIMGAALRSFQLGAQSLWFDELISVITSRTSLAETLRISSAIDPPLYYLLLHFWLMVSQNDGWIRALSAVAGIATIPVIYFLARQLFESRVATIAAFIFTVAPLQLFYAQEARMYSLLIFFSSLAIWTYVRAQHNRHLIDWVLWSIATILAFYSHIFAGMLLAALDVDALFRWYTNKSSLRPIIFANVIIGLALVPWMVLLLPNLGYISGVIWLTPPNIVQPLLSLTMFIFGYTLGFPASAVALFITLTTMIFVGLGSWSARSNASAESILVLRLLFMTVFLPILATFIISQWRPLYLDRWLLEVTPALYILLAWGIVSSNRRIALRICAVLGLILVLVANGNYFANSDYAKSPYRDAIQYVADHTGSNELVVHTSGSTFLAGLHYDSGGQHILLNHPADRWLSPPLLNELGLPYKTNVREIMAGQTSFWVIVALDHIPDEQRAEKTEFDRHATLTEQTDIGGISVLHYTHQDSDTN